MINVFKYLMVYYELEGVDCFMCFLVVELGLESRFWVKIRKIFV